MNTHPNLMKEQTVAVYFANKKLAKLPKHFNYDAASTTEREKLRKIIADIVLTEQFLIRKGHEKLARTIRLSLIQELRSLFGESNFNSFFSLAKDSASQIPGAKLNEKTCTDFAQEHIHMFSNFLGDKLIAKANEFVNSLADLKKHAFLAIAEINSKVGNQHDEINEQLSNMADVLTATELTTKFIESKKIPVTTEKRKFIQDEYDHYAKYMDKHNVKACRKVGKSLDKLGAATFALMAVGVVLTVTGVFTFGLAPLVALGVIATVGYIACSTSWTAGAFFKKYAKDNEATSLAEPIEKVANIAKRTK